MKEIQLNRAKVCFKCNTEKSISDFYVHKQMPDGHFNKCKDCTKSEATTRLKNITSTPEGHAQERAKQREKYYRLNYKGKNKPSTENKREMKKRYYDKYPEKYFAKIASQHIQRPINTEQHHWSYNSDHWKDVLFLTKKDHSTAHRFIVYDHDELMYRTLDGGLLDTKESHQNYINKFL